MFKPGERLAVTGYDEDQNEVDIVVRFIEYLDQPTGVSDCIIESEGNRMMSTSSAYQRIH